MTATKLEVSDLVIDALESALQSEGECRLISAGRKKGLLPGGKLTAVKSKAIQQCLDSDLGLFTLRKAAEEKNAASLEVDLVSITRLGIQLLLERKTPDERREVLENCANPHKELAQEVLLELAEKEIKALDAQRLALEAKTEQLIGFAKKLVEDRSAVLNRVKAQLDKQRDELQHLLEGSPQQTVVNNGPAVRTPRSLPSPTTEGDLEFQQHLCRELVFAWQDNPEPDARMALETAMSNSGLERVGEPGETVSFDNRDHQTKSDLLPGQAATVVEPGWQLVSMGRSLLISRAQVRDAKSAERATHGTDA
jgi:hypothetical protein